jgi:hypothetical protein
MMKLLSILSLAVAFCGCATKPRFRSAVEYRVPLTNGFVAYVQSEHGTLRVVVRHGDNFITDLMTDGEKVQFTQNLDNRSDKTQAEKDSGFGSVVWMAIRDGKLTRHYLESFDGKTQRQFYDRDNDYFFDERVSIDVDQKFKPVTGTKRREQITHQFIQRETTDTK